jgi:hypothetical protein
VVSGNASGNEALDKALRLLVYGPVGFAAYLRDTAPTFVDVFVARGRREVEHVKRAIETRLGLARSEPEPSTPRPQRVADGGGRAATQAGNLVAAMAGPEAATEPGPAPVAPDAVSPAAGSPAGEPPSDPADELPITGYDQLSASQVIERLDGLSQAALDRIRSYELAHRARRAILASIEHLTG